MLEEGFISGHKFGEHFNRFIHDGLFGVLVQAKRGGICWKVLFFGSERRVWGGIMMHCEIAFEVLF